MMEIRNAKLIGAGEGIQKGSVTLEGSRILEVTAETDPGNKSRTEGAGAGAQKTCIDAEGLYLSPGFLDMHMHGGFGFDFETCGTAGELREALRLNALDGVTGVMPTHSGRQELTQERKKQYACFAEVMQDAEGPQLLGVHMEGPFFPAELAPGGREVLPDPEKLKVLLEEAPCLKRMSIAPEIRNGLETISFLEEHGVATSLGHAAPDSAVVKEAIRRGSRQVTHLYSGMKGAYRDEESVRHPGLIELSYLFDELAVELIANGKHLDLDLLKLVFKIKGPDGIFLVTDSHARDLALRGDKSQYVLKKRSPSDGKYHFNPAMPMPEMLRILVKEAGIPLCSAVKTATETPARLLHMEDRKGKIAPGFDADLVAFDEDFNIRLVIARGVEIVNEIG